MDLDHSGQIDYSEFIATFIELSVHKNEKYLRETFARFDKDGNGKINKEELKQILYKDG